MAATTEEGKLTAWERWELAAFEEVPGQQGPHKKPGAAKKAEEAPPPPPEPEVVMPTAEEVAQIREQARQEGYQTGYREGQAKVRGEAERLHRAAGRLEESLAGIDSEVAEELLGLALEVARQVVRQELKADPQTLLHVVREALAQLPHQHASIFLHPEDASLLRSHLGDQLAHAGHRIHEDMKLARGDCILEAGGSHLDATVATRWRRTLESLGIQDVWTPPEDKA